MSRNCSSLQFYTLTDEHLHLVKCCFSIRQKLCTQNGCLLLHKSTLNNTDISPHTTLKIKLGYRVCFAKLLQEYLLQSTHPSLKIKVKKEKLHNLTFLFLWLVVYPQKKTFASHILKLFVSTVFYANRKYLQQV